jgi:hypothetical protein
VASRTFTDARGVQWTVWSVSPSWAERRFQRERRVRDVADIERERRHSDDRRQDLGKSGPRVKISETLTGGWLAFEGIERRRLSPIPADWETMSDRELNALCDRATPVPGRRGRLIE